MRQLPLIVALLASASSVNAQTQAEEAFSAAAKWTVLVRGAVAIPFEEDEQGSWTGSGFLVDTDRGWILTNAHVASSSPAQLTVMFKGHKPIDAERVYVDPYVDLAVLQFDPAALPASSPEPVLACDALPPTGHPVGAFGHPWGYRFTGTRGITSAMSSRSGPDMIQTDAPINEGNSGGALISLETGAIVGVNASVAVSGEQRAQGIGFAVPMSDACTILALLREGRDPSPPQPLVQFAIDENDDPTLTVAKSRLPKGSLPLAAGDTIVKVGEREVTTQGQLADALRGHLDAVQLTINRDGNELTIRGAWPAADLVTSRTGLVVAGALFAPSNPAMVGLLTSTPALMVHHVDSGSEAEMARIERFDLLASVDGQQVNSLEDLNRLARAAQSEDRTLRLMLMRLGDTDALFKYQRASLTVDGIDVVGGASPKSPELAGR